MRGFGDDRDTSSLPDRIANVVCGVGDDGDTSPLPDELYMKCVGLEMIGIHLPYLIELQM